MKITQPHLIPTTNDNYFEKVFIYNYSGFHIEGENI